TNNHDNQHVVLENSGTVTGGGGLMTPVWPSSTSATQNGTSDSGNGSCSAYLQQPKSTQDNSAASCRTVTVNQNHSIAGKSDYNYYGYIRFSYITFTWSISSGSDEPLKWALATIETSVHLTSH